MQESLPQTCSRADKKLTMHRDGETDQTLLKLLLPMLMLMFQQLKKSNQGKNFHHSGFFTSICTESCCHKQCWNTQGGTEAEGWDELLTQQASAAEGLPHVHTSGDAGLGAALMHLYVCSATLQPPDFISACSRSETSLKMVIGLLGWMLLFWELDCRKNLLSRWDGQDGMDGWGSV